MYENQLNELREVMEKIRSGAYSAENKGKRQQQMGIMASRASAEVEEGDPTDSFEGAFLEAMLNASEPYEPDTMIVDDKSVKEYSERTSESGEARPKSRGDFYTETGLTDDPAFMAEVDRLQEKYPGLTKSELFRTIQGESGFNPKAQNKSGASGLFQFMPATAAELGFTTDEVIGMEPAEQVRLYDMYLDRWGYKGDNSLGIMQAAPAYANASSDQVIYAKGTAAWEQNPGWRPSDGGDITVASINDYYRSQ